MGNEQTRVREKRTLEYSMKHMNSEDIKNCKDMWRQLYKETGYATRENFHKFTEFLYENGGCDKSFETMLFRALDQDRNGKITFMEFLWYRVLFAPTKNSESIPVEYIVEMTFLMYDENGDGFLSEQELLNSLTVIMKTYGFDVETEEVRRNIDLRVSRLMTLCDENNDGLLSQQEIISACKIDPTIVKLL